MPIDQFTKADFENALAGYKVEDCNFEGGEWVYRLKVTNHVHILVRSSINHAGISDGLGENSIRCHLINKASYPIAKKLQRWITRIPGWQNRMKKSLDTLKFMGQQIEFCDECHTLEKIFVVKKAGPNQGRFFRKCQCDKSFAWIEPYVMAK